jgi:hypothetical protein
MVHLAVNGFFQNTDINISNIFWNSAARLCGLKDRVDMVYFELSADTVSDGLKKGPGIQFFPDRIIKHPCRCVLVFERRRRTWRNRAGLSRQC